mgnify:CR=1 FL=1
MNIKSYLRGYPYINIEMQRLQKELNALIMSKHDTYCTLHAAPLTGMPSGNSIPDSVYQTVQVIADRYDHKINFYVNKINNLIDDKALFEKVWFNNNVMTNEDRAIIEFRCFERYRWPDIARKMRYSEKQCQRFLDKTIQKMQLEVDKLSDDVTLQKHNKGE